MICKIAPVDCLHNTLSQYATAYNRTNIVPVPLLSLLLLLLLCRRCRLGSCLRLRRRVTHQEMRRRLHVLGGGAAGPRHTRVAVIRLLAAHFLRPKKAQSGDQLLT